MKIIPAINCENFDCVSERILKAAEFSDWAQIDVSDGAYSKAVTWNNPAELFSFMKENNLHINIEAHLMVEDVLGESLRWLQEGAKRIVVQAEVEFDVPMLLGAAKEYNAEAMLSFSPETEINDKINIVSAFKEFQALSVAPGFAGQEFDGQSLNKIKSLRELSPSAIIEVDGGVNEETAKLIKKAGADVIVSASYIFGSDNPEEAFRRLKEI